MAAVCWASRLVETSLGECKTRGEVIGSNARTAAGTRGLCECDSSCKMYGFIMTAGRERPPGSERKAVRVRAPWTFSFGSWVVDDKVFIFSFCRGSDLITQPYYSKIRHRPTHHTSISLCVRREASAYARDEKRQDKRRAPRETFHVLRASSLSHLLSRSSTRSKGRSTTMQTTGPASLDSEPHPPYSMAWYRPAPAPHAPH